WDTNDHTAPDSVADLDADIVTNNSIYWAWTVPGDDHAVGQPWQHKLVNYTSPITSANFPGLSPVSNLPPPACVGSAQSYTKIGLAACTPYYAAIQVVDESNNYSPIGHSGQVWTLCVGGGGGGGSAHVAREEGQGGDGAKEAARPSSIRISPAG